MVSQTNQKIYDLNKMEPYYPNETEFDLSFHMTQLLREEPFFATISRYIKKVATESIPTAGVRLNGHTCSYELAYNPKFFLMLEKPLRIWVLKHELYPL